MRPTGLTLLVLSVLTVVTQSVDEIDFFGEFIREIFGLIRGDPHARRCKELIDELRSIEHIGAGTPSIIRALEAELAQKLERQNVDANHRDSNDDAHLHLFYCRDPAQAQRVRSPQLAPFTPCLYKSNRGDTSYCCGIPTFPATRATAANQAVFATLASQLPRCPHPWAHIDGEYVPQPTSSQSTRAPGIPASYRALIPVGQPGGPIRPSTGLSREAERQKNARERQELEVEEQRRVSARRQYDQGDRNTGYDEMFEEWDNDKWSLQNGEWTGNGIDGEWKYIMQMNKHMAAMRDEIFDAEFRAKYVEKFPGPYPRPDLYRDFGIGWATDEERQLLAHEFDKRTSLAPGERRYLHPAIPARSNIPATWDVFRRVHGEDRWRSVWDEAKPEETERTRAINEQIEIFRRNMADPYGMLHLQTPAARNTAMRTMQSNIDLYENQLATMCAEKWTASRPYRNIPLAAPGQLK